jgi:pimeloyl-ACP methyl ester carboxylesterase
MQSQNTISLKEAQGHTFFFQSEYTFQNEPALCSVEAQVKFTAMLTIPMSFFVAQVAIAQTDIAMFWLWNSIACFLGSFPMLIIFFSRAYRGLEPVVPTLPLTYQRELYNSTWRGWRTCHTRAGNPDSKVTVILIHGFGGSIGHWRQNISTLAEHYNVYAIDLLGFGASDKPDALYSIDLWVEQTYDFWKEFIGSPVILVGNSIGSVVCLSVAAQHPEMVRGVAMISLPDLSQDEASVPLWARPLLSQLKAAIVSPWVLTPLFYFLRQHWVVRYWAGMAYACTEAITDELLEILVRPALEQDSVKAFCSILKAMIRPEFSPNVKQILNHVQAPLLLLWGKEDRMIPIALGWQLLSHSPKLELIELDDAGHCAHDDRPEQVNGELLHWIDTKVVEVA